MKIARYVFHNVILIILVPSLMSSGDSGFELIYGSSRLFRFVGYHAREKVLLLALGDHSRHSFAREVLELHNGTSLSNSTISTKEKNVGIGETNVITEKNGSEKQGSEKHDSEQNGSEKKPDIIVDDVVDNEKKPAINGIISNPTKPFHTHFTDVPATDPSTDPSTMIRPRYTPGSLQKAVL
jgi:hypothetical protein